MTASGRTIFRDLGPDGVARLNRCLSFKRGVRAEPADALVQEIHRDGVNNTWFAQYLNGVTQLVADESHELAVSVPDVHLHHEDTVRCGLRHCRDTGLHDVAAALPLFDVDDAVAGVDRFNQVAKRLRSLGCPLDQRDDAGVMGPYGRTEYDGIQICNVSVVDEQYRLVHPPTVIDFPPAE